MIEKADLGYVVFVEELGEKQVQAVREASQKAGFPDGAVRDMRARNAFIRAIRELQKDGLIEAGPNGVLCDKLLDDEDVVTFQFSKRYLESSGARYDRQSVVQFTKSSGSIQCSQEPVKVLAETLFDRVQKVFKPHDIHQIVARLVKATCKRLHLRDGVYFFPHQRVELVQQIKSFYDELHVKFHVYPVNHSNVGDSTLNIMSSAIKDVTRQVQNLKLEIEARKSQDTGAESLTPTIARNRLEELQAQLIQYRELAEALGCSVNELLEHSGEAGRAFQQASMPLDSLISHIQNGGTPDSLVLELVQAANPEFSEKLRIPVSAGAPDVDLFAKLEA